MASSRKKQDELNLKTLRELGALPQNKFCFDCGQRGPTYVDVTIGSFVCTKCSGILRGLTPPHRVKSISMATFTLEEIDTLRNKGNDYCKKVWLGLYEGTPLTSSGDEQQVRDFMIEKYERKRFYLEKGMTKTEVPNTRPWTSPTVNGSTNSKISNGTKNGLLKSATINNNILNGTTVSNGIITNGTSRSRPEVKHQNGVNNNLGSSFAVDFDKADIFSNTTSNTGSSSQSAQQDGFADFEHNSVYNASKNLTNGMPTQSTLNAWTSQQPVLNPQNGLINGSGAPLLNSNPPPIQDKYAALKDLDNEMKQQQQQDGWSTPTTGSTGSLYSSSTPTTGSAYGSPSPQGSIFGSPSQGQFMNAFIPPQENSQIPNPFGTKTIQNPWANSNGFTNGTNNGFTNGINGPTNGVNVMNGINTMHTQSQQGFVNPFRDQTKGSSFTNVLQPIFPNNGVNGLSNGWGGNPFKVGTVNTNNPFL